MTVVRRGVSTARPPHGSHVGKEGSPKEPREDGVDGKRMRTGKRGATIEACTAASLVQTGPQGQQLRLWAMREGRTSTAVGAEWLRLPSERSRPRHAPPRPLTMCWDEVQLDVVLQQNVIVFVLLFLYDTNCTGGVCRVLN